MTISAATSLIHGNSCHVSKASVERQIRRLEKQKEQLIEKLGGGDGSSEQDIADLSLGNLTIGGNKPTEEAGSLGASLGQALRSFSQSLSEPPPAIPEAKDEDYKEIMKQIQLIEMQIMTLKRQLGDDSAPDLKLLEKSNDNVAGMAHAAIEALISATLSAGDASATVCVDEGKVDTYA